MLTNSSEDEFSKLTAMSQMHMRSGSLDRYASDLKDMAKLFYGEKNYFDSMKVLMLAFYIDLSGIETLPHIDIDLAFSIVDTMLNAKMTKNMVEDLYLNTVRADVTPRHCMTIRDSLHLLKLIVSGDFAEANRILTVIVH